MDLQKQDDFSLLTIDAEDLPQFKKDMQEAFQKGADEELEETDSEVLPERDIDESLRTKGAVAYKAVSCGKMLGGAIVVINSENGHNQLHFLYVKHGCQSKGLGQKIWRTIEKPYPQTKIWETCTPYFETRNIHFYVNRCGFHIVEFFNSHHKDPESKGDLKKSEYFFRFEKKNELKKSGLHKNYSGFFSPPFLNPTDNTLF